MFALMRNRLGIPGLIAVIALVFAMIGSAYAAKKYVITSTSQIKPSVLKSLQGKPGPAGANGSNGAKGDPGAPGTAGANGKDGTNGTNGEPGEPGEPGSPWTAGGVLPPEATETGAWSIRSTTPPSVVETAISFPIQLAAEISETNVHIEPQGFPTGASAAEIEECPGSAEAPKAKPGHLCVYISVTGGAGGSAITPALPPEKITSFEVGASKTGASLIFRAPVEEGLARGSWAVTAP
jgi:hypothetical protein